MKGSGMEQQQVMTSLGFIEKKVVVGSHICQIYSNEDECVSSILKYLLSGLQSGERVACFSEKVDEGALGEYLSNHNFSIHECQQHQKLILAGTREVYFKDNVFDPDRMLGTLSQYHRESESLGFPASRVIGEMTPEIQSVPGGNRLLEYESRVSQLLIEQPVTAVCQYNVNSFDGETIMDVLSVHPQMIVDGVVINNPMYIPPEEFLKKLVR